MTGDSRFCTVLTRPSPDVVIIEASGELDLYAAPHFSLCLAGALDGTALLIVDLDLVTFMDSAALGVLIDTVRDAEAQAVELRVVCPPGALKRVIAITGLEAVLAVHETRGQALLAGAAGDGCLPV